MHAAPIRIPERVATRRGYRPRGRPAPVQCAGTNERTQADRDPPASKEVPERRAYPICTLRGMARGLLGMRRVSTPSFSSAFVSLSSTVLGSATRRLTEPNRRSRR